MLRISEIYVSVQGEGPHVGHSTVFVRFGGCNLRCPLWPCDTQHAIDAAKYRHEWRKMTAEEIYAEILDLTDSFDYNICLTGGEPFLQPDKDLLELVKYLKNFRAVEVFSNGTLEYPDWVFESQIHFIMDWKLPGSGEDPNNPTRYKNIEAFNRHWPYAEEYLNIKFTIADDNDYELAKKLYKGNGLEDLAANVYYGVVWGKMTNEYLISKVLGDGLPWKLNVQIHNHIWNRDKRGI